MKILYYFCNFLIFSNAKSLSCYWLEEAADYDYITNETFTGTCTIENANHIDSQSLFCYVRLFFVFFEHLLKK